MDANPSHQTNSVNVSNDRQGVANIIDMGSITILLVIKLLETTQGQWLYRCVQTHDIISGTIATARK